MSLDALKVLGDRMESVDEAQLAVGSRTFLESKKPSRISYSPELKEQNLSRRGGHDSTIMKVLDGEGRFLVRIDPEKDHVHID